MPGAIRRGGERTGRGRLPRGRARGAREGASVSGLAPSRDGVLSEARPAPAIGAVVAPRRIFLLAGEPSGDLQASFLAEALLRRSSDIELWGIGGAHMEASGVRLIRRSDALGVVGLFEVLAHAREVLEAYDEAGRWMAERRPDLFIPVDYPDFNFRLLPRARRLGIPVVWYIGPQLWAWRPGRIDLLRRYARRVLVLFPFEEALYRRANVPVSWIGHPLVERLAPLADEARAEKRKARGLDDTRPCIALLPGSRRSELSRLVPLLRATREEIDARRRAAGLTPAQWLVGRASALDGTVTVSLGGAGTPLDLDGTAALELADLAVVASGTATLEAALLETPSVVVYKTSPLTYALARRLVKVPHIAMANLVAGARVFPELLQDAATPGKIADLLDRWLNDPAALGIVRSATREVRAKLGSPGAADRAARSILEEIAP